jgi:hypothetical protein
LLEPVKDVLGQWPVGLGSVNQQALAGDQEHEDHEHDGDRHQ